MSARSQFVRFCNSGGLTLFISAEDKVDRLEACTASLPPEAAEPDAQQEAAVAVAAEPDVQQAAAAAVEPVAQQQAAAVVD